MSAKQKPAVKYLRRRKGELVHVSEIDVHYGWKRGEASHHLPKWIISHPHSDIHKVARGVYVYQPDYIAGDEPVPSSTQEQLATTELVHLLDVPQEPAELIAARHRFGRFMTYVQAGFTEEQAIVLIVKESPA